MLVFLSTNVAIVSNGWPLSVNRELRVWLMISPSNVNMACLFVS